MRLRKTACSEPIQTHPLTAARPSSYDYALMSMAVAGLGPLEQVLAQAAKRRAESRRAGTVPPSNHASAGRKKIAVDRPRRRAL